MVNGLLLGNQSTIIAASNTLFIHITKPLERSIKVSLAFLKSSSYTRSKPHTRGSIIFSQIFSTYSLKIPLPHLFIRMTNCPASQNRKPPNTCPSSRHMPPITSTNVAETHCFSFTTHGPAHVHILHSFAFPMVSAVSLERTFFILQAHTV